MAIRPVFIAIDYPPFFQRIDVEFVYQCGFSGVQKKLNIKSLHEAFFDKLNNQDNLLKIQYEHVTKHLLEISTKSNVDIGTKLSAFNLKILCPSGRTFSVESAFQSSKVFEHGGPFIDLLNKSSLEAKSDKRLKTSGKLKSFKFFTHEFPLEPKTYFYNWLYINALIRCPELADKINEYDSFSDIEFNPMKSINCQAEAAAIFVGLKRAKLLNKAIINEKKFRDTIYNS